MGDYASSGDVTSEFKDITFGASTPVTSTEVDNFIDEAESEINSRLSLKYVVPITGTVSLKLMKMITVWMVAERLRAILEIKEVTQDEQGQDVRPAKGRKEALQIIGDILKTKMKLTDAELATSHSGVKSFATSLDNPHTFKRNCDQW